MNKVTVHNLLRTIQRTDLRNPHACKIVSKSCTTGRFMRDTCLKNAFWYEVLNQAAFPKLKFFKRENYKTLFVSLCKDNLFVLIPPEAEKLRMTDNTQAWSFELTKGSSRIACRLTTEPSQDPRWVNAQDVKLKITRARDTGRQFAALSMTRTHKLTGALRIEALLSGADDEQDMVLQMIHLWNSFKRSKKNER